MKNAPPLTVLMPAHREGVFLAQALRSIQRQSVTDWRMVLVLDSPDSRTESIARGFAREDSRIDVLEVSFSNIGCALREGAERAYSEFVLRMDADDVSHRTRFQQQLAFMSEEPQIVAAGSNARFMDRHGFVFDESAVELEHSAILEKLLRGNGSAILHPTAVFRRDALMRAGSYALDLPRGEDLDLYLRMSDQGNLANHEKCLLDFRKHSNSFTAIAAMSSEVQSESLLIRENIVRTYLASQGQAKSQLSLDRVRVTTPDDFHVRVLSKAFENRRWLTFSYYAIRTIFSPRRLLAVWREIDRRASNRGWLSLWHSVLSRGATRRR